MIIRIVKRENTNRLSSGAVKYEFIESDSIVDFGYILSKTQIENLKYWGNTVISYEVYKALGEKKIKAEIKRLTGVNVNITLNNHEDTDDGVSVLITKVGLNKKKEA